MECLKVGDNVITRYSNGKEIKGKVSAIKRNCLLVHYPDNTVRYIHVSNVRFINKKDNHKTESTVRSGIPKNIEKFFRQCRDANGIERRVGGGVYAKRKD